MSDPILDQLRRVDPDAEAVPPRWGELEYLAEPFGGEQVIIADGRQGVPYLRVARREDGSAFLLLDHRFGLELPADAELRDRVVHFVAEAIAVGGGYASIERLDVRMPFRGR